MANTYLSRTSGTPTNALKWTFSAWVKIASIPNDTFLLDFNTDGNNRSNIGFQEANDRFIVYEKVSGSTNQLLETTRVFRDHNAWYHIVASCDRTLATASDRTKIYINGVRETSFSTETQPTQNATGIINTGVNTLIGKYSQSGLYFDGCLSHVHFVDGTAYDASTFGETDATSGIWKSKTAPSVTYGNNGFFLKFENSGAMGTDSSGNSNTFAVGGGTLTQNVDTPDNNFATLNPLPSQKIGTDCFYEYGNTNVRSSSANFRAGVSGIYVNKGKWYFEMQQSNNDCHIGIAGENKIQNGGTSGGVNNRLFYYEDTTGYAYSYTAGNGMIYFSTPSDGTQTASYGNTFGSSDTVGCFADLDNNKLYFSKNGTIQNSGTGYAIQGDIYYAFGSSINNGDTSLNYGNGSFKGVKLTGTTFADANGEGIFKYSPNQAGASNFDSAAKNFYTLNTKNLKEFG